jgi:GTPase SAR1 family protein
MEIDLIPEAKAILNKSDKERLEYISMEHWIDYPVADDILNKLEELYKYGHDKSRYISILLIGSANNGKTSLLKKFIKSHPAYDYNIEGQRPEWVTDSFFDEHSGVGLPVLYIISPTEPSETRLYSKILSKINAPFNPRDTIDTKESLVHYYLRLAHVKMIVVDEIHNTLSGSTAKQNQFMNAIRDLSTALEIPIVLAGVKEALRAVQTEEQISSRYRPEYLTKWKMDKDYVSLLATIISMLPLHKQSNILNKETATEILELSNGYIGEIIGIIKAAGMYAIKSGSERVTIKEIRESGFNTLSNVHKTMNLKDI